MRPQSQVRKEHQPVAIDSITIDVIANALKSLIYEMDAAIERTAMSIIIRLRIT